MGEKWPLEEPGSTPGEHAPLRRQEKIPFAVVGADQEHQVNGKRVLGRKTKWGIIEGERSPLHPQPSPGLGGGGGRQGCGKQHPWAHPCLSGCWGVQMVAWSCAGAPAVLGACRDALPRHPSGTLPSCLHPASPAARSALLCSGESGTLRVPPPAGPADPVRGGWGGGVLVPYGVGGSRGWGGGQ